MNELNIIAVTTVTDSKLKKELENVNKAITASSKASWQLCKAVNNIITGELFITDFKTEKAFAEFIGLSKAQVNKLKRAFDLYQTIIKYDERLELMTVSKVMEMLPIQEDEITIFLPENEIDTSWTVLDIRESVKEWTSSIEADEVEGIEEDEQQESKAGEVNTTSEKKITDLTRSVKWNNTFYMIPLEKEKELIAFLESIATDIVTKA